MTFVGQMLAHTPPYVFLLLAYLAWQGVLSVRTRRQSVWRMLVVPSVFIASGLLLLVLWPSGAILPMAAWLAGLVAFVPLGVATRPPLLEVDRARGPGNTSGKPRAVGAHLLVFAAQFAIAVVLLFRRPAAQASLAVAGHAVSGTSVGYFIGWVIGFRCRCRTAPGAARSALEATPAAMVRNS